MRRPRERDESLLTVEDEGPGDSREQHAGQVFERFYRARGIGGLRQRAGARDRAELAELMGGSVELGVGTGRTSLTLVLPAFSGAAPFSRENERLEEPSLQ